MVVRTRRPPACEILTAGVEMLDLCEQIEPPSWPAERLRVVAKLKSMNLKMIISTTSAQDVWFGEAALAFIYDLNELFTPNRGSNLVFHGASVLSGRFLRA
jgi:hypothetical protein